MGVTNLESGRNDECKEDFALRMNTNLRDLAGFTGDSRGTPYGGFAVREIVHKGSKTILQRQILYLSHAWHH